MRSHKQPIQSSFQTLLSSLLMLGSSGRYRTCTGTPTRSLRFASRGLFAASKENVGGQKFSPPFGAIVTPQQRIFEWHSLARFALA